MQHLSPALTFTFVVITRQLVLASTRQVVADPPTPRHYHDNRRAAGGIIFTEYALTFSKYGSRSVEKQPVMMRSAASSALLSEL